MAFKLRDWDLEIKAVEKDGSFSGYASVFGVVDAHNERVVVGAFARSIAERKARGRRFPVLWQHRTENPLGIYEKVEEDDRGLFVEGKLLTDDVAQAREAHALLKSGAVSGLSIGYYTREASVDEATGIRSLSRVDLEEISLVTIPANDEARVDAIKMKLAHGALPSLSEFERLQREAGFSRRQAAIIASRGFKHLLSDSGETATEIGMLVERLSSFTLPKI